MPPILDVAIGTVFIFLLFSLVVTAANEIWLSLLDKRAAFLKLGLEELLHDGGSAGSGAPVIDAAALLRHGLISSLSKGQYVPLAKEKLPGFFMQIVIAFLPGWACRRLGLTLGTKGVPSYIPGKSFVLALLALVQPKAAADAATPPAANAATPPAIKPPATLEELHLAELLHAKAAAEQAAAQLHASIGKLPASKLRDSLLALFDDAAGDLDHFKANVENWFNESMDRVGGWYKRYAQQWLFALALICAVVCNINTVHIIQALSTDPKLRDSVVAQATAYANDPKSKDAVNAAAPKGTAPAEDKTTATAANSTAASDLKADPEREALDAAAKAPEVAKFRAALGALRSTGIPIGWTHEERLYFRNAQGRLLPAQLLTAIAGWLVTALAASLGAPFWFDVLNRFMDIRGVGRAPEEKDPTAPKKKSTSAESYLQTGDAQPTS